MLTEVDHELYKNYKKLAEPEYFQIYYMAWYEQGGFFGDYRRSLRTKLSVYDSLGLDRQEMAECQDIVPASVLLAFWNGADLSDRKCREIHKTLPAKSEKKTLRITTLMN